LNKLIIVMIPVALIVAVVALGMAGIVQIPGLTPAKKSLKKTDAMYGEKDDKKLAAKNAKKPTEKKVDAPKPKPKAVAKTSDPELGAEALAAVWNEMKAPELTSITKSWPEAELAKVLKYMDTGKVAKFLAGLVKGDPPNKIDPNPTRASNLSKKLQDLGSILPTPDASS
jgi:hypothetical protein